MELTFTFDEEPLKGKRAAVVAQMIEKIVTADGEPVSWEELSEDVEHPHQYTPALHALELVGAIERWKFQSPGKRRESTAYSLTETVEVVD